MSRKKNRPAEGDYAALAQGYSIRDIAAVMGVSKTEIHSWLQLAVVPEKDFEMVLAEQLSKDLRRVSSRSIISAYLGKPSRRRDNLARTVHICPCCGEMLVMP